MREKLLINDIHLGVQRASGTTPASAAALRSRLMLNLRAVMFANLDKDIIINGDIFDAFFVSMGDLLEFYLLVAEWLETTQNVIVLGRGNHDWSKDSTKLSSFDVVGELLVDRFGDHQVRVVKDPEEIFDGIYMIPHAANQDVFDLQLASVPAKSLIVLVHANFDNRFAVERDHSLNVTREQAWGIIKGAGGRAERYLIFGHEHQAKRDMDNHLIVTGNQWPTSVSDCQGNPEGLKHAHIIHYRDGSDTFEIQPVKTWQTTNSYRPVDWRDLAAMGADDYGEFIRVEGHATALEAPQVIRAIARLRQEHDAFVIANAVKIEGVEAKTLEASAEEVTEFNVLQFLYEHLNDDYRVAVQSLLEEHGDTQ